MESESLYTKNAAVIKEIPSLAKQVQGLAEQAANEEDAPKAERIGLTIAEVAVLLKTADPLLVSETHRNNIGVYLSNIKISLSACITDSPAFATHFESANTNAENLRKSLPFLLSQPSEIGIEELRKKVITARQSASQQIRAFSSEAAKNFATLKQNYLNETEKVTETFAEKHNEINNTYDERLTAFEGDLTTKRTEFETEIKEKREEIESEVTTAVAEVTALKKLSAETTESIDNQKDRLEAALAEFQKQFSERIGEYQSQFSAAEEDRRQKLELSIKSRDDAYKKESKDRTDALEKWQKTFTNAFEEGKTTFAETSNDVIEELRNYAQEAKVTVGLMSEKSLQNDFLIQADKEKTSAQLWNFATFGNVILLLAAIGFIFYHTFVNPTATDSTGYPHILSKFLVTVVIGVIARWTSRQANRHLAEERRLRRLALELATINPFLSNLPDDIQYKVKEALAMKYYGNQNEEKPPFGEMAPIHDGDGGIKSVPGTIIDNLRGK
jgi:hypothetical protein